MPIRVSTNAQSRRRWEKGLKGHKSGIRLREDYGHSITLDLEAYSLKP